MTCASDGLCEDLANRLARKEMLLDQTMAKCEELRARALEAERLVPRRDREKSFRDIQHECGRIAKEKGWDEDPTLAVLLALQWGDDHSLSAENIKRAVEHYTSVKRMADCMLEVTEIAEAAEEIRVGRIETTVREDGKPEGYWSEKADAMIRMGHVAEREGVDLQAEIELKNEYNRSRSHRHGNKVL